jgi:hypothetical protein
MNQNQNNDQAQKEAELAAVRKLMREAFDKLYKKPSLSYLLFTLPIAVMLFFISRVNTVLRFIGNNLFTWLVRQQLQAVIICLICWVAFLNGLLNLIKQLLT